MRFPYTDLNDRSIETAKACVYGTYALRNTTDFDKRNTSTPADGEKLQVKDEVRARITFSRLNLSDDAKMLFMKGIDLVFCCNVLIYFDLPSKRKVVQHFFSSLQAPGYFFLGHAESLYQITDQFRLVHLPGTTTYLKSSSRARKGRPSHDDHDHHVGKCRASQARGEAPFAALIARRAAALARSPSSPSRRNRAQPSRTTGFLRKHHRRSTLAYRQFAVYARARPAESIQSAIFTLGIQRIEDILLSNCFGNLVPGDKWVVAPAVFWRHSFGCALVCREFAEQIDYYDPDRAYLAGLLHDLGIIVNSLAYTDEYRQVLADAVQSGRPLHEQERESLGFTHCDSGVILGKTWQSPRLFGKVIERHHDVERVPSGSPSSSSCTWAICLASRRSWRRRSGVARHRSGRRPRLGRIGQALSQARDHRPCSFHP